IPRATRPCATSAADCAARSASPRFRQSAPLAHRYSGAQGRGAGAGGSLLACRASCRDAACTAAARAYPISSYAATNAVISSQLPVDSWSRNSPEPSPVNGEPSTPRDPSDPSSLSPHSLMRVWDRIPIVLVLVLILVLESETTEDEDEHEHDGGSLNPVRRPA